MYAGPRPLCSSACDANGDGKIDDQVADALYILNDNFLAGPLPPASSRDCDSGMADDVALGFDSSPEICR